ncbi:hypothetical protein B0H34DRAFT_642848, partial [Crassisporium funariophilum]
VQGCEGECIRGIVTAVLGNYTRPTSAVLEDMANSISTQVIQNTQNPTPPMRYLSPIVEEYNKRCYKYMEHEIFEKKFHGKCQNPITGLDPAGCPNPDCPVVCGTPGSIIHFYLTFRYIAFNATVNLLKDILKTDSPAFQQVEQLVQADIPTKQRRLMRFMRKMSTFGNKDIIMDNETRAERVKDTLAAIFRPVRSKMTSACGGTANGKTNGLPDCTWEAQFKEYISTFP